MQYCPNKLIRILARNCLITFFFLKQDFKILFFLSVEDNKATLNRPLSYKILSGDTDFY